MSSRAKSGATLPNEPAADNPMYEFRRDTACVLAELRSSLGVLLEAVPGGVRTAGDIQRGLGLDKALSWQVYRVGTVHDPIDAGPDVPARAALARAMRAASKKGLPDSAIARVLEASDAFEALVERHAGERSMFDTMVRALREGESQVHSRERRAAFRCNAALWGCQLMTHYNLSIFGPSEDGQTEDCIHVVGRIGYRALRAGLKVHINTRGQVWSTSASGYAAVSASASHQIGLIEAFSTKPFPTLSVEEVEPGKTALTFTADQVGKSGELTYFISDRVRNVGPMPQPWWGSTTFMRAPTGASVTDVLVPVGWSDPSSARVETYGSLRFPDRAVDRNPSDRLPIREEIAHLGSDIEGMRTPLVPRCPELVREVLEGAGGLWRSGRYDIFRVVAEYPILLTGVSLRIDAQA